MTPSGHGLGREIARLGLAIFLASGVVTLLSVLLDATGVSEPGRVARKILVPAAIVAYAACVRLRWKDAPRSLGLTPVADFKRSLGLGFLAGAASVFVMLSVLFVVGARVWAPDLAAAPMTAKVALYAVQALGLGLLEEVLFRGLLHRRLEIAGGPRAAQVLGALIFALAHFLRPTDPSEQRPWAIMLACFQGLSDVPARWREAFGLFLVGWVLAELRNRTGRLHWPIGVHAGWVWMRLTGKRLSDATPAGEAAQVWVGTSRIYDGVAGWGALLLTLFCAGRMLRAHAKKTSDVSKR